MLGVSSNIFKIESARHAPIRACRIFHDLIASSSNFVPYLVNISNNVPQNSKRGVAK